ncbi:MAG: glycosyltransferase family 4 protein [Ruminococcaceae bacterium]|nr:glycosyltransferase family 4 protein [Oscillospiraceae bacterium]
MKILITSDLYSAGPKGKLTANGVITSVKNLQSELEHLGHEVRVLTLSDTTHSYKEGKIYYICSMPALVYPNARITLPIHNDLVRELILWKPDVIHSQCEISTMPYADRISRCTGAPIVHTFHTMYEQYVGYIGISERFSKYTVSSIAKWRLRNVSLLIAPSTKTKKALESYSLKAPIRVIPSGISLSQHRKRISAETRKKKREELGIGEKDFVLVFLGRLGKEKNIDELLRLFSRARRTYSNLRLLIVGGGPAKEELEERAAKLGIDGRVIFTGMVDPALVQTYYQLGDVFVCASTSETQGLTYIEAAANGLPLLCRKDPCLTDILKEGENGFSYANAKEFMKGLSFMAANPEWRRAARKKSETLSLRFDKAVFGKSALRAYAYAMRLSRARRKKR